MCLKKAEKRSKQMVASFAGKPGTSSQRREFPPDNLEKTNSTSLASAQESVYFEVPRWPRNIRRCGKSQLHLLSPHLRACWGGQEESELKDTLTLSSTESGESVRAGVPVHNPVRVSCIHSRMYSAACQFGLDESIQITERVRKGGCSSGSVCADGRDCCYTLSFQQPRLELFLENQSAIEVQERAWGQDAYIALSWLWSSPVSQLTPRALPGMTMRIEPGVSPVQKGVRTLNQHNQKIKFDGFRKCQLCPG